MSLCVAPLVIQYKFTRIKLTLQTGRYYPTFAVGPHRPLDVVMGRASIPSVFDAL
jgi:hypothetical protein